MLEAIRMMKNNRGQLRDKKNWREKYKDANHKSSKENRGIITKSMSREEYSKFKQDIVRRRKKDHLLLALGGGVILIVVVWSLFYFIHNL